MIVECRGATVGDRGSMPWMPAYIAVPNLFGMISMGDERKRSCDWARRAALFDLHNGRK
jgi:hypothetical protein